MNKHPQTIIQLNTEQLKSTYKGLDQFILVLMIIALPIYGMIYLYHTSGNLDWGIPEFPSWINQLLIFGCFLLLIAQELIFRKKMSIVEKGQDLLGRLMVYSQATKQRYSILFVVTILSAAGLLLFDSAFYNLIFALTLLFFSLGKPNPTRINKLLKLNEEEKELIRAASRPH